MFIGIDQSYSGLAMTNLHDDLTHETVRKAFPPKKHGSGVNRLLVIEDWIDDRLDEWTASTNEPVRHICMEGYSSSSKFGREIAGELGYAVKRTLYMRFDVAPAAYPTIVPPSSLKKYVTGSGGGKKNTMLLAVYKKWGIEFTDDNDADSYGLSHVARDLWRGTSEHQYERDVTKALHPFTEAI